MENKKNFVIGVLGGMGTYATIHFFKQYAEIFPAVKEWDRPRIIIDNNCTMPSRVRAILYNENVELLVNQMTDSISHLIESGANKIVLACNTSHLFLDKIYEKLPNAKNFVINAIENCAEELNKRNVKKVCLLATEGTIQSKVYEKFLSEKKIECLSPTKEKFPELRNFIEAVKQNKISSDIEKSFVDFICMEAKELDLILGCTELPILYEKCSNQLKNVKVYDPLQMVLEKLKLEYCHL